MICTYDEDKVCIGCYRTVEEIAKWDSYNDEMKLKVLENTAQRRAAKGGGDYYGLG